MKSDTSKYVDRFKKNVARSTVGMFVTEQPHVAMLWLNVLKKKFYATIKTFATIVERLCKLDKAGYKVKSC